MYQITLDVALVLSAWIVGDAIGVSIAKQLKRFSEVSNV